MAELTYAQKFSFAETVAEIMLQSKQTLADAGLEVEKRHTNMLAKNKSVTQADAAQEKLKADLVEATRKAVAAVEDSYHFASSALDAMVGVLGKNDPLAKRLRQLRDQMRKGGGTPPPTT